MAEWKPRRGEYRSLDAWLAADLAGTLRGRMPKEPSARSLSRSEVTYLVRRAVPQLGLRKGDLLVLQMHLPTQYRVLHARPVDLDLVHDALRRGAVRSVSAEQ